MTHVLATCLLEREEHNLSFALSNNNSVPTGLMMSTTCMGVPGIPLNIS